MGGIFISYRRDDTSAYAGRIYDRLQQHFGDRVSLFIDVASINPGSDFVKSIGQAVASCDVLIAVVGRAWLQATDPRGGRRIDNADDFVRIEIESGLEHNIGIIPVLVSGAQMPTEQQLPATLAALSRRQAVEVSDTRFHGDVTRLIEALESYVRSNTSPAGKSLTRLSTTVTYTLQTRSVYDVAFSCDGHHLASCGRTSSIEIWDAVSGTLSRSLPGERWNHAIAFSREGHILISGSQDSVKVWSVTNGHLLQVLREHRAPVSDVAFSPAADLFASASFDESVKVWSTDSKQSLHSLTHDDSVLSVVFSPDGQYLATAVSGGVIRVWRTRDGSLVNAWRAHGEPRFLSPVNLRSVAYSPDGKYLASGGSADKTVKIWDATNGTLLRAMNGHSDSVNTVVFSPTSGVLASGGKDRTIKLWKADDGSLLQELVGHSDWVVSLAFSHDGKLLASGGRGNLITGSSSLIKIWGMAL
jgi:WD40 repeat protein